MAWEALLRDLSAQLEAAEHADLEAEARERAMVEAAHTGLADRLRAVAGRPVRLRVAGHGTVHGTVGEVGPDWLRLSDSTADLVVPLGAVATVRGADRFALSPPGAVAARYDLRMVLRALWRASTPLVLTLRSGDVVHGTVRRVGADHLDIVDGADTDRVLVALAELASVRLPADPPAG